MILTCNTAQNVITAQQTVLKSQWTIGQGWLGLGLSRVGAVPKEIEENGQHYIQYIVGFEQKDGVSQPVIKKVPLEFDLPTLFKLDAPGFQCFGKYIGFDEAHYKAKKPAVEQMGSYHAEFMQDQLLEISDVLLDQLKAKGASTAKYEDLKKFTQDDEVDASALGMNLASWQGIKAALEDKNVLTVYHLVANHDAVAELALQKGALICRVQDWGKKFYMSDKKEYQILCEKPATLAETAIAADKDLPAGAWKTTPSDFKNAAQQLKMLNLKPANLKEAGEAYEVMPDSAQGVLNVTGYQNYKAISKTHYFGLLAVAAVALAAGFGVGHWMRGRKSPKEGGPKTGGSPGGPDKPDPASQNPQNPKKPKAAKPAETAEPKVVIPKDAEAPRAVANTTVSGSTPDVLAELAKIAADKSPAGGTPSGASLVTADNVIMPRDAAPLDALDASVVRAQVLLTYRKYFMSQADRDALLNNQPLSFGDGLMNSPYAADVNDMVESLIRRYHERGGASGLADLWDAQRERGFIPRGGVPERLLLEICGERIARAHADGVTRFAGEFSPDAFSREATDRLGNTDSFRKGLMEVLR